MTFSIEDFPKSQVKILELFVVFYYQKQTRKVLGIRGNIYLHTEVHYHHHCLHIVKQLLTSDKR